MLTEAQRRRFLERVATYGGLLAAPEHSLKIPGIEWRRFEAMLRRTGLRKGDFFIRPGEPVRTFALVLSGLLRFFYIDRAGKEATKAFRGPYELAAAYPEMLLGIPARSHIQALEDCELLVGRYEDLQGLYRRHPCWLEVGRLCAEQYFIAKERREFEFLQQSASERYLTFLRERPDLAGRLPQYQIASYLGITPVALSRIVGRLRRSTGLRYRRRSAG